MHILKQAGVDVEPELEEFRRFLAEISGKTEISGKKIEEKKFPQVQKEVEVITSQLATAVWLNSYIGALKDLSAAKI